MSGPAKMPEAFVLLPWRGGTLLLHEDGTSDTRYLSLVLIDARAVASGVCLQAEEADALLGALAEWKTQRERKP